MTRNVTKIDDEWEKLLHAQNSYKGDHLDHKELINSYFFIYDCFDNKIIYTNSSYEIISGFAVEEFSLEKLLSTIHPDDLSHFYDSEEKGLKFTNSLSFNEHYRYILNYSYRIQKADGSYIRISQQCQGLDVDTKGCLTKTLVKHLVIDDNTMNDHEYKVYDKLKGIYINGTNCYNLTKRELEIIDLINEGFSSEQIAQSLFISKNTIITHRRNILNKMNTKSFLELLQKMRITAELL
ncbi:LuxR C-terminal-related transcriptional regulator [Chryseobacterium sp.]|uniref:LuxR C-terminal-related transcriptional regulator n=1 Tax=Chryseobacterium sp. TaxID=1871047 RepID=UPI00388DA33F